MPPDELTHRDLDKKLNDIERRSDAQHAEVLAQLADLKIMVAGTTASHSEQLSAHSTRITKIEGREWRAVGAVTLGALSLLGSALMAIFSLL